MDNWRNLILVTDTQKQEMAQAARQARMLRDLDGARRAGRGAPAAGCCGLWRSPSSCSA